MISFWSGARASSFQASAWPHFRELSSLSREVVSPLRMEWSAVRSSKVTEMDEDGNAVCPPTTHAVALFFLQHHLPLEYRADIPSLYSAGSSPVKNRKLALSKMKTRPQSRKMTETRPDKDEMRVEAEIVAKMEDVADETPALSGA